jgi:hypothetical protein
VLRGNDDALFGQSDHAQRLFFPAFPFDPFVKFELKDGGNDQSLGIVQIGRTFIRQSAIGQPLNPSAGIDKASSPIRAITVVAGVGPFKRSPGIFQGLQRNQLNDAPFIDHRELLSRLQSEFFPDRLRNGELKLAGECYRDHGSVFT